jgi:hypothetical protein
MLQLLDRLPLSFGCVKIKRERKIYGNREKKMLEKVYLGLNFLYKNCVQISSDQEFGTFLPYFLIKTSKKKKELICG